MTYQLDIYPYTQFGIAQLDFAINSVLVALRVDFIVKFHHNTIVLLVRCSSTDEFDRVQRKYQLGEVE